MSFLYPAYLWAAGLVATGVLGLHFLTPLQPIREMFPTVRFVPEAPLRSTALSLRFSDLRLLLLRILAILLIGAAFAQPRIVPWRRSTARIALVDVSGTVARTPAWQERVKPVTDGASAVILFDDTAREVTAGSADLTAPALPRHGDAKAGSLSTGLVAALRSASRLRDSADNVELSILSPFLAGSYDASTPAIRALWPGRIDLIPTDAPPPEPKPAAVRVEWVEAPSSLWVPRAPADTATGVTSEGATLIAPFERKWRLAAEADSGTRVIARWLDGEPAAVEREVGGVRVRSVGFAFPKDGDAALRPEFERFADWLNAPGGDGDALRPLDPATLATLAGAGPAAKAAAFARSDAATPLAAWLLAAGLAAVLLEMSLRRRLDSHA